MRGLLAIAFLIALVGAGAATAGRGDPQERLTRVDQARAKSIVLQQRHLPAGFRALPATGGDDDYYCRALDESDLTLTGETTREFVRAAVGIGSVAQIYESLADANASWRRGTSRAGQRCIADLYRRALMRQGVRDVTFARLAFPRLAQRSVAFRLTGFVRGIPAFFDLVVLQHARAHAGLLMTSALQPVLRAEQIRLARLVASRMAKAMRR
ncbi:MAG: hypothetical protein ACRDQT_08055 [Gaiellaceae bacterium]